MSERSTCSGAASPCMCLGSGQGTHPPIHVPGPPGCSRRARDRDAGRPRQRLPSRSCEARPPDQTRPDQRPPRHSHARVENLRGLSYPPLPFTPPKTTRGLAWHQKLQPGYSLAQATTSASAPRRRARTQSQSHALPCHGLSLARLPMQLACMHARLCPSWRGAAACLRHL